MDMRFVWIIIFLRYASSSPTTFGDSIGILHVTIKYENEPGIALNGNSCDSFIFNRLCDIFLEICAKDSDPSFASPCNLISQKTEPVRNAVSIRHDLDIHYFTNDKLSITIRVHDYDHFSAADVLGEYQFSVIPAKVPETHGIEIKPIISNSGHSEIRMKLYLKRECQSSHFGDECKRCYVEDDHGYCDSSGNPVCYPGYYGESCHYEKGCRSLNCAPFASCALVDGTETCVCDGTSGKICEKGYDPCTEWYCLHEGKCVPTGEHLNFAKCINCGGRWSGLHCDKELNVCEFEESKLGHPLCLNGGHCISSSTNETEFTCLCVPGWQGTHCEVSFSKASSVVTIVAMFILIVVICCIIGLVCCVRIFALPKLRSIRKMRRGTEQTPFHGIGFSKENNIYDFEQYQVSLLPSYSTITYRRKADSTLITLEPLEENNEYEYDALTESGLTKFHSTTNAPEPPTNNEEYESILYEYTNTIKSEGAMSVANNNYDIDVGVIGTTLKRPLPLTPQVIQEDYEFSSKGDANLNF